MGYLIVLNRRESYFLGGYSGSLISISSHLLLVRPLYYLVGFRV